MCLVDLVNLVKSIPLNIKIIVNLTHDRSFHRPIHDRNSKNNPDHPKYLPNSSYLTEHVSHRVNLPLIHIVVRINSQIHRKELLLTVNIHNVVINSPDLEEEPGWSAKELPQTVLELPIRLSEVQIALFPYDRRYLPVELVI